MGALQRQCIYKNKTHREWCHRYIHRIWKDKLLLSTPHQIMSLQSRPTGPISPVLYVAETLLARSINHWNGYDRYSCTFDGTRMSPTSCHSPTFLLKSLQCGGNCISHFFLGRDALLIFQMYQFSCSSRRRSLSQFTVQFAHKLKQEALLSQRGQRVGRT